MKTLILKENNSQIREKLLVAGIKCCECCKFKALWLNYDHAISQLVHGVGYPDPDEGTTSEQEIERFTCECKDPYYCKDLQEFINEIKKQQTE